MDTACRGCLLSFTTVCCLATSDDHPPSSQLDLLSCLSLSLFLAACKTSSSHLLTSSVFPASHGLLRRPSLARHGMTTPMEASGGMEDRQQEATDGRTDGDGRSHQRYATAPPRGGGAERCSRLYGHAMAAFAWLRPYVKPLISSALTLSFPPPPCHSPALRALPPPCHRSTCAEEFQSG